MAVERDGEREIELEDLVVDVFRGTREAADDDFGVAEGLSEEGAG